MQRALPKQPNPRPQSKIGLLGESLAVSYLQKKSYIILARNYRGGKGELDIVAVDGDTLVFIEVKTRTSTYYGSPKEAVTKRKIDEIIRAGHYFSRQHPEVPKKLRIDVIAILLSADSHAERSLEHVINVTG